MPANGVVSTAISGTVSGMIVLSLLASLSSDTVFFSVSRAPRSSAWSRLKLARRKLAVLLRFPFAALEVSGSISKALPEGSTATKLERTLGRRASPSVDGTRPFVA